jgi:hypothetical protein
MFQRRGPTLHRSPGAVCSVRRKRTGVGVVRSPQVEAGSRRVFGFGGVGIRRSVGASIRRDIDGGRRGHMSSRAVPRL